MHLPSGCTLHLERKKQNTNLNNKKKIDKNFKLKPGLLLCNARQMRLVYNTIYLNDESNRKIVQLKMDFRVRYTYL
jgi:hypothetical protein